LRNVNLDSQDFSLGVVPRMKEDVTAAERIRVIEPWDMGRVLSNQS